MFLSLWKKIENNEPTSEIDFFNILQKYFAESTEALFGKAEGSDGLRRVAREFIDDAQELRPLIKDGVWKNPKFMEELQRRVETVPYTNLGLLNKSYRSHASRIVAILKQMAKNMTEKG